MALRTGRRLLTVHGDGKRAVLLRYVRMLKLANKPRHGMPKLVLVGPDGKEVRPDPPEAEVFDDDLPF